MMRACGVGGWVLEDFNYKLQCIDMLNYRKAKIEDLNDVSRFVDWWLSGRGKAKGVIGAVNDCFISKGQHSKYILKYTTLLCLEGKEIIGWAVVERSNTLIHLLIKGDKRGLGIGKAMMKILQPKYIRSKLDQSTGNPILFYEKLGYKKVAREKSKASFKLFHERAGKILNIDILERGHSYFFP